MSFIFNCPYCGQHITAEEAWIGREAACPTCSRTIKIQKNADAPSEIKLTPANQPQGAPQQQNNFQPQGAPQQQNNFQPQGAPQPQYSINQQNNPQPQYSISQQQYGAVDRPPFKNYMGLAIFTTVLCCLPLGIVSIILSSKASSQYASGQYDAAYKSASNSKICSIIGLIGGGIVSLIYLLSVLLPLLSASL